MLTLARALGWLISAFHKTEAPLPGELRAVTVRMGRTLSILGKDNGENLRPSQLLRSCRSSDCQHSDFLEYNGNDG